MKAYIASHIFTPSAIGVVENIKGLLEQRLQLKVFSPYHASREIWNGRAPKDCSEAERQLVLQQNIDNLDDSDILVSWINREDDGYDGRVDTGVAWEVGYFCKVQRTWDMVQPFGGYASEWGMPARRPVSIGYVNPNHKIHHKGINLMLTGTMDAVVTSTMDLEAACRIAMGQVSNVDPFTIPDVLRSMYSPQRKDLQEADEIR